MKVFIDHFYRKERLLSWEFKSLSEKYSSTSFFKNFTWKGNILSILVFLLFGLIVPFMPNFKHIHNWNPPIDFDDYFSRFSIFTLIMPIIVLVIIAFQELRIFFDLKVGMKLIGNFRITKTIFLGFFKILILNHWRLFFINSKQPFFNVALNGHIITIKRTLSYKLIGIFIRDELRFIEEKKTNCKKI